MNFARDHLLPVSGAYLVRAGCPSLTSGDLTRPRDGAVGGEVHYPHLAPD